MIEISGIEALINKFETMSKKLDEKLPELPKKLCEIGKAECERSYQGSAYAGPDPEYDIEVVPTENGCELVAHDLNGQLLFMEFGTGVMWANHPKQYLVSPRGTRGLGRGAHPPWVYMGDAGTLGKDIGNGKVLTYGQPATPGMYHASQLMRNRRIDVVKELMK